MPQLTAVIEAEENVLVAAVTSLDSRLFVLFYPNEEKITVYDATKFTVQKQLTVAGLGHSTYNGLVPCVANDCLYVSDYEKNAVHRVALSGDNEVLTWSVPGGKPRGLSLSNVQNLIVACYGDSKIREYETDGNPVREIDLRPAKLPHPWHAVQLTDGQYLISRGKPVNDVVLLDEEGRFVDSYTLQFRRVMKRRWNPIFLQAGKNGGFFLVADHENSDISLFRGSSLRTFIRSEDDSSETESLRPLDRPWTLHLNELTGRLYIGELFGRVLAFDVRCH
jgi:hypothetical protein